MELNKYQTPIDKLTYTRPVDGKMVVYTFENSPKEIQEEFMEYFSTVPMIQWLTSKDRPDIGDLPKDEEGKAIWDIERPPIITNTDFFRPTAIHYEQTGRLTDLRPNRNPNSEYQKWVTEEVRRIREGYLRDDGAYITGNMYWYLNYSPIVLTEQIEGTQTGYRKFGLPEFWEGVNWRYIGWKKARDLGLFFGEISKRGSSKSYTLASGLSRIFVVGENPRQQFEKASDKKNERAVIMAYQKEFLIKDGTLNKFEDMFDFLAQNTQFPRKTLKRSLNDMDWIMGYVDLNTGTKKGTGNEVLGMAIKDDTDKGRGKRAQLIGFEEFGKFPNVADVIKVAEPSVKEGDLTFGLIVAVGTGGEEGNDFSGALDLIYHPSGSHFLSFENVWDKSAQARGTSIFCFPAYVNRKGCYDKDGISDVTKALFALCWEAYIAKYENPDPIQVTRTKAENPITLQDAIMRRDRTKFPVAQITERIQEIDLNPNFYDSFHIGKLVQNSSGKVEFLPTGDTPIRRFPTKDNKVAGAIEISELPQKNSDGNVFRDRYIAGIDPVQNDEARTMSLVSIFVLDLWTDSIVCEWTGRLAFADDCYEVARLICKFYNAKLLYENNKQGVYGHFRAMNSLYLLAETPEHLKSKGITKVSGSYGNSSYGVYASNPVNDYALGLIKDFMLKPVMIGNDDEGNPITVPNVMTWWNRALLEEARQWNPDGNFDRISALGMLMIYRAERLILSFGEVQKEEVHDSKASDPYFERNYRRGKRQ